MDIPQIVSLSLDTEVLGVTDSSNGVCQDVKIVDTSSGKYVIKSSKTDMDAIFRQRVAYQTANQLIPMPRLIAYGDDFLIEEFVSGHLINKAGLSEERILELYFELGQKLKRIHTIKKDDIPEESRTRLSLPFSEPIQTKLERLKEMGYLNEKFEYLMDYFKNPPEKQTGLLHGDLSDNHVFIKDGKISGVIDWGCSRFGRVERDFAVVYIGHKTDSKFQAMVAGYGGINLDSLRYITAATLVGKILFGINRRMGEERRVRLTNLLEEII